MQLPERLLDRRPAGAEVVQALAVLFDDLGGGLGGEVGVGQARFGPLDVPTKLVELVGEAGPLLLDIDQFGDGHGEFEGGPRGVGEDAGGAAGEREIVGIDLDLLDAAKFADRLDGVAHEARLRLGASEFGEGELARTIEIQMSS